MLLFCAGSAVADLQLQVRVRPHSLISGITHSILAYLFLERHGRNVAADALRRFFFYFDAYAALVMWKVGTLYDGRLEPDMPGGGACTFGTMKSPWCDTTAGAVSGQTPASHQRWTQQCDTGEVEQCEGASHPPSHCTACSSYVPIFPSQVPCAACTGPFPGGVRPTVWARCGVPRQQEREPAQALPAAHRLLPCCVHEHPLGAIPHPLRSQPAHARKRRAFRSIGAAGPGLLEHAHWQEFSARFSGTCAEDCWQPAMWV